MQRKELPTTDKELISLIQQGYGLAVKQLHFVEIGSYFSFVVEDEKSQKYFLKIYPQNKYFSPIDHVNPQRIEEIGGVLKRLTEEIGLSSLPHIIPTQRKAFFFKAHDLLFVLFDYIKGTHPSYSPNELRGEDLAHLFTSLHQIPSEEFADLPQEDFDIYYVLGIRKWLDENSIEDSKMEMLKQLHQHSQDIRKGIDRLEDLQKQFKNQSFPFVLTHGDGHHFNVLQNERSLSLVDWDGIKIAPRERDLWHYENAPLMSYYKDLNPDFMLNHNLCHFYLWQRFLEDLRYYLEQGYASPEQAREDRNTFMTHWGWTVCVGG